MWQYEAERAEGRNYTHSKTTLVLLGRFVGWCWQLGVLALEDILTVKGCHVGSAWILLSAGKRWSLFSGWLPVAFLPPYDFFSFPNGDLFDLLPHPGYRISVAFFKVYTDSLFKKCKDPCDWRWHPGVDEVNGQPNRFSRSTPVSQPMGSPRSPRQYPKEVCIALEERFFTRGGPGCRLQICPSIFFAVRVGWLVENCCWQSLN